MDKNRVIMKNIFIFVLISLGMTSCEKVWDADLTERALDTIRGIYAIESITWEGAEPIDLNCDGTASWDYYAEWKAIETGIGDHYSVIYNHGGQVRIPVTKDSNASWNGPVDIIKAVKDVWLNIAVIIEGNDSRLQLTMREGYTIEQTGYAEFTLRTKITVPDREGKDCDGEILIKYIRIRYSYN